MNIGDRVSVYAGADEVLCALIARHLTAKAGAPKVALVYSNDTMGEIFSRYEGQTIARTIESHLKACGVQVTGTYNASTVATAIDADFALLVHLPDSRQGDHVLLPGLPDLTKIESDRSVEKFDSLYGSLPHSGMHCRRRLPNGSDPQLVEKLLYQAGLVEKNFGAMPAGTPQVMPLVRQLRWQLLTGTERRTTPISSCL